ncbi:uncharacterized protein LOC141857259 [Brevipalpus obovatus]|uniref:uncharacterized protein LOC141857259 n=1 Tax=Brevipalpus obovatus TaxID=246614 RepID=UPI003D9F2626
MLSQVLSLVISLISCFLFCGDSVHSSPSQIQQAEIQPQLPASLDITSDGLISSEEDNTMSKNNLISSNLDSIMRRPPLITFPRDADVYLEPIPRLVGSTSGLRDRRTKALRNHDTNFLRFGRTLIRRPIWTKDNGKRQAAMQPDTYFLRFG